jgi:hypothetical protein
MIPYYQVFCIWSLALVYHLSDHAGSNFFFANGMICLRDVSSSYHAIASYNFICFVIWQLSCKACINHMLFSISFTLGWELGRTTIWQNFVNYASLHFGLCLGIFFNKPGCSLIFQGYMMLNCVTGTGRASYICEHCKDQTGPCWRSSSNSETPSKANWRQLINGVMCSYF